jgi:hypothetical protein
LSSWTRPSREAAWVGDDAEDILAELTAENKEDDDPVTDGGIIVGFLDQAWPQPTDNRRRLWAFGTPVLEKETPTK